MSNNALLVEKLKLATEMMSCKDGTGSYIISPKWVMNTLFNNKGEYRKAKIQKILNNG